MEIRMIITALLAFLIAVAFGRFYIPWLKQRGASQPLKKEVAEIYEERDRDMKESDESSAVIHENAIDDDRV